MVEAVTEGMLAGPRSLGAVAPATDIHVDQIGGLPAHNGGLCSDASEEFSGYAFCGMSGVIRPR